MKITKKTTLGLLLSAAASMLPTSAFAAAWSSDVTVTSMEMSSVNMAGVWVAFSSDPISHSCSAKNGQYMLGGGTDNVNKQVQALLAAQLSGRPVRVYWNNGCSGGGTSGYPILVGTIIK